MNNSLYKNPHIYSLLFRSKNDDEKNFYLEESGKSKGEVLYIGPGDGRIMIPMLQKGINVTGIDDSHDMVLFLKEKMKQDINKNSDGILFNMDVCNLNFNKKFDLIILPNRVFCYILSREEQKKTLTEMHGLLNKGGRVILNYFSPTSDGGILSIKDKKVFYKQMEYLDKKYMIWTLNKKNPFTQNYERYFFIEVFNDINAKECEYFFVNKLRYTYVDEFENLAELCGFKKIKKYGSFDKSEYDENSKEIIWNLEK